MLPVKLPLSSDIDRTVRQDITVRVVAVAKAAVANGIVRLPVDKAIAEHPALGSGRWPGRAART